MKVVDFRQKATGRRTVQGRVVERCPKCGEPAVYLSLGRCDGCGATRHAYCHVARYSRTIIEPRMACVLHADGSVN